MKKTITLLIIWLLSLSTALSCNIVWETKDYLKMTPDCIIDKAFETKIDKIKWAKYLLENDLIELSVPHIETIYSWNDKKVVNYYPVWFILKFLIYNSIYL